MDSICRNCGGKMEAGYAGGKWGLAGSNMPRLQFVIPGVTISWNPITAFKQGLAEEPGDRKFSIEGLRCSDCGALELFAKNETPP